MDRPLTPEYAKEVANAFIQTYYQSFDNGPRENLSNLYVPDNETSQMMFEGNLVRGQQAIMDKIKVKPASQTWRFLEECMQVCDCVV